MAIINAAPTESPDETETALRRSVFGALGIALLVVVVLGAGYWARHHAEKEAFTGATRIEVHERNFHISLTRTTVETGRVAFAVHNDGPSLHEFVVFRTDVSGRRLPLDKVGNVVEDAPQLHDVLDSGRSLNPGAMRALVTTLPPGHYVAVCNLPAHYRLGMHVDFTVTPDTH